MKKTFEFLNKLDKNNDREWFLKNKKMYEQSHDEMLHFAQKVIDEMSEFDHIETMSGKRSLFRIYRDVRFGVNKTPYKTNWAGRLRRATDELRGGYYYQIGPSGSFVLGGFFGPNPKDLLHIRKQLEQDSEPLRVIINSDQFKGFFGDLRGSQVKTAPRGFDKQHPEIDLLRYKQFIVRHDFTDEEVFHDDFSKTIALAFDQMRPFFDAMTDILTTDLNGRPMLY